MYRILFSIFCFWVISACSSTYIPSLTFCVEGAQDTTDITLQVDDSVYVVKLDSTFSGELVLNEWQQPKYAILKYVGLQFPMYLEPGKTLDVLLKVDPQKVTPQGANYGVTPYFTGEGAAKNDYLNHKIFVQKQLNFRDSLDVFLNHQLEFEQTLIAHLDSMKFDETFVNAERNRIKTYAYRPLLYYPLPVEQGENNQQAINRYYDLLTAAVVEDGMLINLPLYRRFITECIQKLVRRGNRPLERVDVLRGALDFVQQKFTCPDMQEYLIDFYLTEYVSNAGVKSLDEFIPLYEKKVVDLEKRAKFNALCDTWKKIEPGAPSPTFAYTDINDQKVSLEDFRGKYVYIDVWATWCGPCCGEIPHLKELEHHFKKKNIAFVSISCDRDKEAWKKMVKKEKLGGIQLHNGGDRTFMNDYMVKGIPRFILLDREGKIINSRMTRPSNPETAQFIETLEGL